MELIISNEDCLVSPSRTHSLNWQWKLRASPQAKELPDDETTESS